MNPDIRNISLRQARMGDAEAICEVHAAAIRASGSEFYSDLEVSNWVEGISPHSIRIALSESTATGFVAEFNGTIVGFSVLHNDVIRAIYVHPEFSRIGIGTLIIRATEQKALSTGKHRLFLRASLNSPLFYQANGYTVLRKTEFEFSEKLTLACYDMEKLLFLPVPA